LAAHAQQYTVSAEAPVIRVSGEGTSSSNPDMLRLQIAVVTHDTSAQGAAAENASVVGNVLQSLRALLGIGSSVTTVDYSLSPRYVPTADGREQIQRGFTARNTLRVETADFNKAGQLIDAAIAAGANDIGGIEYTLRNQAKLRADAMGEAARDARAKAEALAAAMNVKLGSIRKIEDSQWYPAPMAERLGSGEQQTEILSGPVRVHATVTITFDIAR
jgi:uncharacterized protein YggE